MTRFEKKEELIGLFSSGSILIGDMLDEAMDFAEKNIEKEATRKIVECSEFLAKLPHWISVEDELPPLYEFFLYFGKNGVVRMMNCNNVHHGRSNEEYLKDCIDCGFITHWMPLPAPPTCSGKPNNCTKGGEK